MVCMEGLYDVVCGCYVGVDRSGRVGMDKMYIGQRARAVQGGRLKFYCVRTRGFKSHR